LVNEAAQYAGLKQRLQNERSWVVSGHSFGLRDRLDIANFVEKLHASLGER
jgi:hypothetical protein